QYHRELNSTVIENVSRVDVIPVFLDGGDLETGVCWDSCFASGMPEGKLPGICCTGLVPSHFLPWCYGNWGSPDGLTLTHDFL
ncbi:MAG: hypothetical protein KDA78_19020, partial [Planctomycetaceae bacterium]|nr:hypothetical protein [Planctomycetaceae bacterium]